MTDPTLECLAFTPRCLKCGSYLHGLEEQRCPQCVRPFDLADPRTYTTRPPMAHVRAWLIGVAVGVTCGLLVFVALRAFGHEVFGFVLGASLGLGVIYGFLNQPDNGLIVVFGCATFMCTVGPYFFGEGGVLVALVALFLCLPVALMGMLLGWLIQLVLRLSGLYRCMHSPAAKESN